MTDAKRLLAVLAALTFPVAGHSQTYLKTAGTLNDLVVLAGYDELAEKDRRRVDFYADKIVVEIKATVAAGQAGDQAAFSRHGNTVQKLALRFLEAAETAGLTESEADFIFRRHLIENYSGPLPPFLVNNNGPAGVRDLGTLEIEETDANTSQYVNDIRTAGDNLFSE
ncbi:MAG: hypothetical protein LJE62_07715 [Silicimonas sp.]|nr:hypothetical protein [Silicimonas sp.]